MVRASSSLVALSGCCGLALGAQLKGSAFLEAKVSDGRNNMNPVLEPKWGNGMKDVQENGGDKGYHADYPKDDRSNITGDASWTHVTIPAPGGGPTQYSQKWYQTECKKINDHCTFIRGHKKDSTREDMRFLEDEYIREKDLLAERKDKHESEKLDVQHILAEMAECKVTIEENDHCPTELSSAKSRLARLRKVSDESKSDIDKECDIEKEIIEWQKCVDELRAAEALLVKHTESLPKEQRQITRAEKKIPHQEDAVKAAKERWLGHAGVDPSVDAVEENCDAERDELMMYINGKIRDLWAVYIDHKGIYEGKEDTHKSEKADVTEQKPDVVKASKEVADAEKAVEENAHCEPKLNDAEHKLARLVSVPDRSSSDIDEECETEKDVIKWRACVVVLKKAQKVLKDHEVVHKAESADLAKQEDEARAAKLALPPQKSLVDDAYEAWLRAKALRDSANCYPKEQ
jgi:hypothetical protein